MGSDDYVYGLDGGDGFTGVFYPQTYRIICVKYVLLFICQSYLNKVVLKKTSPLGTPIPPCISVDLVNQRMRIHRDSRCPPPTSTHCPHVLD